MVVVIFIFMDVWGDINFFVIDKYVDLMVELGMVGVFVCGIIGEFYLLIMGECKVIFVQWIKFVWKCFKVIVYVGSNC